MKKIFTITIIFIVFFSCKKQLEIIPDYKFPSEIAISNLDSLESITTGAMNQLQSTNLFGGGLITNSELLADNWDCSPISNFALNQIRTRDINAYNGEVNGLWNDGYRAINMANIVLYHLPNHEEQDIIKSRKIKGECLFIRAISHFEMLRMFAQPAGYTSDNSHLGIPIRLSIGSATEHQNTPRSTVEEVYNQIISDLNEASLLLPDNKTDRISKWAAYGYLSKVHFQKDNYYDALFYCNEIINSGYFSLNSEVNEIYKTKGWNFTDETIFQIINIPNIDVSNSALTGRLKWQDVKFSSYFDSIINVTNDDRSQLNYKVFGINRLSKYKDVNMNVTVIRLAEIYLTRAECKLNLGYSDSEVKDDYNLIRLRANNTNDLTLSDQYDLSEAISIERLLELGFEGDHFHNIKRKKGIFNSPIGTFYWNDPKLVYPIPQQEIDMNENMIQNEGY
tara:strand:+ start:499 stop:1851 length:1353 start_codon:yes stop_codon:yes gene_type:complete